MGLFTALSLTFFYSGIKLRFSRSVSFLSLIFLTVPTGMFISGTGTFFYSERKSEKQKEKEEERKGKKG